MQVRIKLDRIFVNDEYDGSGNAEPYLWPVFFKVDNDTLLNLSEDIALKDLPWLHAPGGNHGNIGGEVDAGATIQIPPGVGEHTFDFQHGAVPTDQALVACLAVLMEEDDAPVNEEMPEHYRGFVETVATEVREMVLDSFRPPQEPEPGAVPDDRPLSVRVEEKVMAQLTTQFDHWLANVDDVIGVKLAMWTWDELVEQPHHTFQAAWNQSTGSEDGSFTLYGHADATLGAEDALGEPTQIALRTEKRKYLCAEGGGGREVVANRDVCDAWETFTVLEMGQGKIALQTHNGQYLCAEDGGGGPLVANRDQIGAWELFDLVELAGGRGALRAHNGQYVCAEGGGGGAVVADRDHVGAWETLVLLTAADARAELSSVSLQSHNGMFLCAEGGGGGPVVANRTDLGAWETFGLLELGGEKVALRTHSGQFVCAEGGGGGPVIADRAARDAWETFELVDLGRDQEAQKVALRTHNGQFLCAEGGGGGEVVANRDARGAWETFRLTRL